MAAMVQPLLEKIYYEDCPGCKQEKINEVRRGIPFREFFYVWIIVLCTSLPISSLFPFLYFMVRDFHVAKSDEDIGYYAGYVGSSFMFGRALTSFIWGMLADRCGRKPVIMISSISVVIFNTLFGFSTSFWMAVSTRFLLGSLNALLGPVKAYAIEVCREEHQTIGLTLVTTAWGMGLIIGPALGGLLAQPAEKYPKIFLEDSIFGKFPYLLPCLCVSVFAVGGTIVSFLLPETLHVHHGKRIGGCDSFDDVEASSKGSALKESITQEEEEEEGASSHGGLIRNWPLMSSIIGYCIFSLQDMAYTEIFSLWAVSDKKYGGLSFSSQEVGQVLAVSGFGVLVFQLILYPMAERIFGPAMVSRLAAVLSIPLLSSYPYIHLLSGFSLFLVINCASALRNILSLAAITGLSLLQNNAVAQDQRGAANGISMTGMSLFKAVGPAGGGTLFAWAQKRQHASFLPGDQMVFFTINVIIFIGIIWTFKPFLALPKDQTNEGS